MKYMKLSTDFDTPEELIEAFCRSLMSRGRSFQTVKDRRGDLLALVRWSESQNMHQFNLSRFVAQEYESYRTWLLSQFRESTVNRRLTSLNLLCKWSVRQGLLDSEQLPIIRSIKPKARRRAPDISLTGSDLTRLLDVVNSAGDPDEIAIMTLLAGTGLRISDICLLRWKDFDVKLTEGKFTIAKRQFGQSIQLPVSDPGVLLAILSLAESKQHSKNDLIFQRGKHCWTRRSVEMLIKRYCRLAGVPVITPKVLRYSLIMRSIEIGLSPQQIGVMFGLTRIDTIGRFYDDRLKNFLQSA